MQLLEKDLEKLKGEERAKDLAASDPRATHGQNEDKGKTQTGCSVRPEGTLGPQRIPGTKAFPEMEETTRNERADQAP